jgi:hypothetical protein
MNDELEVPRKRGRPRKHFRPPILSAEQALALQTLQQIAAAEARERKRLRGIARRAEKKVLDSMSIAETIQEFWAESRKLIDPTRLPEWQARQEYVEALLGDIRTVLENRSSDECNLRPSWNLGRVAGPSYLPVGAIPRHTEGHP